MPISPPRLDLERFVDGYESACEGGLQADVREFVPAPDHPEYAEIVVEVCRVDLERNWNSAEPDRLSRYQQLFPDVYRDPRHLERLAFEEYRIRRSKGESVEPNEYVRRFGLVVDGWPRASLAEVPSTAFVPSNPAFLELSRLRPEVARQLATGATQFPKPGDSILGFQLLSELGRGSFGRVFLARQGDLANRLVALKLTFGEAVESQRLARLQHTHITPIFSVHRHRKLQAVCMPFLGRTTLADVVRQLQAGTVPQDTRNLIHTITRVATSRPNQSQVDDHHCVERNAPTSSTKTIDSQTTPATPSDSPQLKKLAELNYVEAVCWLIAQIADGLAHAHERGVLHCDLKPANILLSDDGCPVILDFNTAQDLSRAGGCSAMLGGTLPYMSPEQIAAFQHGGTIDHRSDLYSLGVVFHELLIGRIPFPIRSGPLDETLATMLADRREKWHLPNELSAAISPGLQAILRRCLEIEPGSRYQSARQLHEDLMRHLEHLPLLHVRESSVRERLQKWSYRHPRLASSSLVGTVACLLIAAVALAWWGRTRQVARLESQQLYARMVDAMPTVWVEAAAGSFDPDRQREFQSRATEIYAAYQVDGSTPWYERPLVRLLPDREQRRLREEIGGVLYLDAEMRLREARRFSGPVRGVALAEARRFHQLAASAMGVSNRTQLLSQQNGELLAAEGKGGANQMASPPEDDRSSQSAFDNLWRASQWMMRDQSSRAEPLLQTLVQDDPRHYAARFLLGNCQVRKAQWTEAEGNFTACIALRPDEYAGWYHRGLLRLERRDFAAARDDFAAVLARRPEMAAAYVNRALAERGCGETEAAIDDLTQAIDRGVAETRVWLLRSQYRASMGDQAGARLDYEEWSRRAPTDELSWVTRGVSKIAADPEGSILDFQQALLLNPRSRPALQNLAHVMSERLGQNTAAIAVLGEALSLQPQDAVLLGSRAVLRARLAQKAEAVADAIAACRVGGADGFTWYQAACVHALLAKCETSPPSDEVRAHVQEGLRCLALALVKRPDLATLTDQDHDLDGLRADPRYESVIGAAKLILRAAEPKQPSGVPEPG